VFAATPDSRAAPRLALRPSRRRGFVVGTLGGRYLAVLAGGSIDPAPVGSPLRDPARGTAGPSIQPVKFERTEEGPLARRPNYGFQKRQKEISRQNKKERKAERKRARKEDDSTSDETARPAEGGEETAEAEREG
jgi:hypothetical protein